MKLIEKDSREVSVGGHKLLLTHLNKVLWPEEKYTKGDLIDFYDKIAPFILPYLKDRPLVMHRYPSGIHKSSFYQKNVDHNTPEWVKTVEIKHEERKVNYIVVQDKATLLYVVNLGCFEFHPFHSQIEDPDYPDYLILDLDPESISFDYVIETAQVIHEYLSRMKIKCYCKTSGGRGFHIYIPLGKRYASDQVKAFAELIALRIQEALPDIISLERKPAKRQKKIYVDFLRNSYGQTVVSPYSIRPKPLAPVSTPLKWQEVKKGLDPTEFNMETLEKRLKKVGDLFNPVLAKGSNNLDLLLE